MADVRISHCRIHLADATEEAVLRGKRLKEWS
jgi:hypothetical protein